MVNQMLEILKVRAYYSNDPADKFVPVMFDPQGFLKPDGELDVDAMAHSMFDAAVQAQKHLKKIEADKAAAEDKKDG